MSAVKTNFKVITKFKTKISYELKCNFIANFTILLLNYLFLNSLLFH